MFLLLSLLGEPDCQLSSSIYVSPHGNDAGDGSFQHPMRTLHAARDAARAVRSQGGSPSVLLLNGTHRLSDTLQLTEADGGTATAAALWAAAPGAAASISGGVAIDGWQPVAWPGATAGSVFVADVSAFAKAAAWPFEQILVDRQAWPVARWPLKPPGSPYNASWLYLADWSKLVHPLTASAPSLGRMSSAVPTWLGIEPADLPPNVSSSNDLAGACLDVFGYFERDTGSQMLRVHALNLTNASAPAALVNSYGFKVSQRYVMRNVKAGLVPGRWWLDVAAERLYVMLHEARDAASLQVEVPVANVLVEVSGVRHLQFANLTFTNNGGKWVGYALSGAAKPLHDWMSTQPHQVRGDYAVVLKNRTSDIRVDRCTFEKLFSTAVQVSDGSRHISVTRSLFRDLGQGGIDVTGFDVPHPGNRPYEITIDRCVFSRLGRYRKKVFGVGLGGCSFVELTSSRFEDLPSAAIGLGTSLRRPQRLTTNVRIEGNLIRHTNTETDDVGAIIGYVQEIARPNTALNATYVDMSVLIKHNNISDVVDAESKGYHEVCVHGHSKDVRSCRNSSWAIYLDGVGSGFTIEGNILDGTMAGCVFLHEGGDNNVTNNILVGGDETKQLLYAGSFDEYGHVIHRNIWWWRSKRTAAFASERPSNVKYLIESMDDSLYWAGDAVDVYNGSVAEGNPPLFPLGGGGLTLWRQATGFDASSVVADPRFVDPDTGNFDLKPDSPAWALGWQKIPPINPPTASMVGPG